MATLKQSFARVQQGQRMPGGMVAMTDATDANRVWFQSVDRTGIPNLCGGDVGDSMRDWINLNICMQSAATGNRWLFAMRADNNNYLGMQRVSAGGWDFRFTTGGVIRCEPTNFPILQIGTEIRVGTYHTGGTMGVFQYGGNSTPTRSFAHQTAAISGGNTFNTSIRTQTGARYNLAHFDGTTVNQKWPGYIGLNLFAICDAGKTLADHGLNTDLAKQLALLDPQSLINAFGFRPDQIIAYGDTADSSGNLLDPLRSTQLPASARLVCPFTGKYLVMQGTPSSTNLYFPFYTLPAHPQPITAGRGSFNYLTRATAIKNRYGGGLLVPNTQKDPSKNPHYKLDIVSDDRVAADGTCRLNRWPINIPVEYHYIDGPSNVQAVSVEFMTGATHIGDTHTACGVIETPYGYFVRPYFHSNNLPDVPSSGDRCFTPWQGYFITGDSLPVKVLSPLVAAAPWGLPYTGNASSYDAITTTYCLMIATSERLIDLSRQSLAANGKPQIHDILWSTWPTPTARQKTVLDDDAGFHLYPNQLIEMSDGYVLIDMYATHDDNNHTIAQLGVVMPPSSGWGNNAQWHAFDGTAMDGASGRPLLGVANARDVRLHSSIDNIASFPNPPAATSSALSDVRCESACRWQKDGSEGIARLTRISEGNLGFTRYCDNGIQNTGDATTKQSAVWDKTYFDKYGYDPITHGFTHLQRWDVTEIIESAFDTKIWPLNTKFRTVNVQYIGATERRINQMIVYILDPQAGQYTADTNYFVHLSGYKLKALLFYRLDAEDPTKYYRVIDNIAELADNNSQGYGFNAQFVGDGMEDDDDMVSIAVSGGEFTDTQWGNIVQRGISFADKLAAAWNDEQVFYRLDEMEDNLYTRIMSRLASSDYALPPTPVEIRTEIEATEGKLQLALAAASAAANNAAGAQTAATAAATNSADALTAIGDIEPGGTTQPRINDDAGEAFKLDLVSMADGTYKALGRKNAAVCLRPGAILGAGIAVQVYTGRVFGSIKVETVHAPVMSDGTSITASELGPRDAPDPSAMIRLSGTVTASETPTCTFHITMRTGDRVPVTFDILGLPE